MNISLHGLKCPTYINRLGFVGDLFDDSKVATFREVGDTLNKTRHIEIGLFGTNLAVKKVKHEPGFWFCRTFVPTMPFVEKIH